MKEYIKKILDKLFCLHQYELFHKWERPSYIDCYGTELSPSLYVILICKKCGKIKKYTLGS